MDVCRITTLLSILVVLLRGEEAVVVHVNTTQTWAEVAPRFLSVSIDTSLIANDFKLIDFNSTKLMALCKGLRGKSQRTEVYLRVGGGTENYIIYKPTGLDALPQYVMNNTEWDILNEFALKLDWSLVFGLNAYTLRRPDGSWDPSNAIQLMRYTKEKGYVVQYELGNEPIAFTRHTNLTIPPEQLAKDVELLKVVLLIVERGEPMIIGPDISVHAAGRRYLHRFLSRIETGILDAISYHYYYGSSENATVSNFTDPAYLDRFLHTGLMTNEVIDSVEKMKGTSVWLGETSSTYGSGQKLLGMSFAAGFLFLDKLGLAAQLNIKVMVKQSIVGGYYSLLHKKTLDPTPSYWIALLHKQLVGTKVLSIDGLLQYQRKHRLYAHCINFYNGLGYPASDIVVFGPNLNKNISVNLSFAGNLGKLEVDQYLMTPGNGAITDLSVKLNGILLQMPSPTTLPDMKPVKVTQPLTVPPLSYGFYVLLGAKAEVCMKTEDNET